MLLAEPEPVASTGDSRSEVALRYVLWLLLLRRSSTPSARESSPESVHRDAAAESSLAARERTSKVALRYAKEAVS